ncbi:MAG TPA: class I SAM-dependent methyltransferase [Solirubrobacteraceae bacterium]
MALFDRQRLARLIEGGGQSSRQAGEQAIEQASPPAEQAPTPPPAPPVAAAEGPIPPGAPGRFARELGPANLAKHLTGASRKLYERLDAGDVAEVEWQIASSPELQALYAANTDPGTRRHMVLSFGIWLEVPCILQKSGLTGAQPPEEIHVMARGPIAAAGGLYEADLVFDALASVGVDLADVGSALDFGCSSGRVVRVLQAAYPETRWHGCDPNGPAIDWARENLPAIEFFVNGNVPPTPLADGSLDMAYAISIWSHFAPGLGLGWFEEMHRLIRPGGHLVCTTHGLTSVGLYAQLSLRTPQQADEILGALYRQGSWYAPEFGEEGDWGVVNPDWGTAFLSPEWMLTHLCPHWRVLEFAPGRNQENQDVYVLQRV